MSSCPGKSSWPHLVGVGGSVAKAIIERENPNVKAVILEEGTPVTKDFRCNRVRIWVNKRGLVVSPPRIG
ncbi:inhibitor of trypsin and hageman factor [Cucurbita maxima]|uniref:Inhibitor of trypsin and hageman factor n=1 Tax=Cucurbita maxima TaxID=3661 RepID=A0A6J1IK14_CUCMA|nr:inhibitor of trypsin and hageman factor [Cucurbita maxima]